MKVSFELSPRDLQHFRERLKRVQKRDRADEDPVIEGGRQLLAQARSAEAPEFVQERLEKLEQLIEMLVDQEWRLEGRDRVRILDALAYFVDPEDMIPDRTPGIGYLDDAIMIELIVQELRHEIAAYEDFCAFRRQRGGEEQLQSRRDALQARMRRRRRRDREALRSRGSTQRRSPFGLW